MNRRTHDSGVGGSLGSLRSVAFLFLGCATMVAACSDEPETLTGPAQPLADAELNRLLELELLAHGFTGRIEETLEVRLGRPIDSRLAEVGRLLFFDRILSLEGDNSCSGCH